MPSLHVRVLGRFSTDVDGQPVIGLDLGKAQSLLCYVLLYRDRPHPREALADRFWSDTTTVQSKKHLRQALWQLQSLLGDQALPPAQRLLLVEAEWVRANPGADLWLDAGEFEQAFALVRGKSGEGLGDEEAQQVDTALSLYRGDLLEGCYEDWCLFERERFQNMMLIMLDKLMGYCQVHRLYEAGLDYGERILRYDHASERTYRRLMQLHYLSGDRTAALRQYERCRNALSKELGIEPAAQTRLLYDHLRSDYLDEEEVPPAPSASALQIIAQHVPAPNIGMLDRLESDLTILQHQVATTIRTLREHRETRRDPQDQSHNSTIALSYFFRLHRKIDAKKTPTRRASVIFSAVE